MVPTWARVLGPGCRSLRESLSHRSSTVGLDEQTVYGLELYCRKAGRKREGRKREAETGHGHVKRRGKREREGRLESNRGKRSERARWSQATPLIVD